MGAKDTPGQDQKEYGQVQKEEQDAEMLAATAALEQQNALQVETPASTATPEPQGDAGPAQVERPAGVQPRNLMQIVPSSLLFRDRPGRKRPASTIRYDVGRLWEVLAADPSVPSMTRILASRLKGDK